MNLDPQRVADLLEIHELCSRYMAYASQYRVDQWLQLFTPDGETQTFGELPPEVKQRLGHRGKAVRALVEAIRDRRSAGRRETS